MFCLACTAGGADASEIQQSGSGGGAGMPVPQKVPAMGAALQETTYSNK
jgi:hypothetical protein